MSTSVTSHETRYNIAASTSAARRNAGPIAETLYGFVSRHPRGRVRVLELACGDGAHAAVICSSSCGEYIETYAPTDVTDATFERVRANAAASDARGRAIVLEPRIQDAVTFGEEVEAASMDACVCVNMCHVSSRDAVRGMFRGAGVGLAEDGILFVYGPFTRFGGRFSGPGDEAFDASLRARDAENFGLVDVEEFMDVEAARVGLTPDETHPVAMPANNLVLVYRKRRETKE